MFRYHLKFIIRNFLRDKVFSLINILGLSLGIAAALLIFLWVKHEYSVDRFHKKIDVLYRVVNEFHSSNGISGTDEATCAYLGRTMKEQIPELVNINTRTWEEKLLIKHDSLEYKESMIYSDPSLFEMFTFPMAEGSYETMYKDPYTVVISQKLAGILFRDQNPVGQTVIVVTEDFKEIPLKVTGVFDDFPEISSIKADFIIPFSLFLKSNPWTDNWGDSGFLTTVELQGEVSLTDINKKITQIAHLHGLTNETSFLLPFKDSYLKSTVINEKSATGRIAEVSVFIIMALFTLLIACINFMNLSTARATKRMREIGVKKVIGVRKITLIIQFLWESILMAGIATLFALILTELILPVFNKNLGYHLTVPFHDPVFIFMLAGVCILIGLLSGSYPALFLSSIKPSQVIKGNVGIRRSIFGIREILVIFQFAISIFLIIGTLILFKQIHYIMNRDIGLNRENVIRVPIYKNITGHMEAFKNALLSGGNVINASYSDETPFSVASSTEDPVWPGKQEGSNLTFYIISADHDFISTMGMKIIRGHDFTGNVKTDSDSYIINEEAAREMKLKDPVGTSLSFWGTKGEIIGEVKDFNNKSMHTRIQPLIIRRCDPEQSDVEFAFIKIKNKNIRASLDQISSLYKNFEPDYPFEYTFLDEAFANQYKLETLTGKLSLYFSGLAIFIACLGLLGLSSFVAEQRTKEIGIRKTFGATVTNMVLLLSSGFTKLVLISFLLASPVAYYFIRSYLNSFAYRIDISIWYFASGGIVALLIAWLTVSYQSMRAALKNPVEILRYE